jgi:hypothetical protein
MIINSRVRGNKRAKLTFFWYDNLVIGLKTILVVVIPELIRVKNTSDQSSNFPEMAVTCLVEDVVFCKRSHFNWLEEKQGSLYPVISWDFVNLTLII